MGIVTGVKIDISCFLIMVAVMSDRSIKCNQINFFSLRIFFSRKRNLPGHGSKNEPQPWQFLEIYNIHEMKIK